MQIPHGTPKGMAAMECVSFLGYRNLKLSHKVRTWEVQSDYTSRLGSYSIA